MKIKKVNGQSLWLKFLYIVISLKFSFLTFTGFSQGIGINATGTPANSKTLLDVDATVMNPKEGVLLPRMSTAERNAITGTIPESLLIYNTDSHCFEAYYNGTWVAWGCLGGCQLPAAPTAGTNTASTTQIVWNWNDVSNPVSYKCGTTTIYNSATDIGTSSSYTQTGLSMGTAETLYVWAYNACNNSLYTILTQSTTSIFVCGNPYTDTRDGQIYNTVQINTQCWMAQNLNYGVYESQTVWGPQGNGYKWCYDDNTANCTTYGGLYDWNNTTGLSAGTGGFNCNPCGPTTGHGGIQGLCPASWHVPSHYEWTTLEQSVCAENPPGSNCATDFPYDLTTTGYEGTTEGSKLKATISNNPPWNGTNTSGFNALPSGYLLGGAPTSIGDIDCFWSATEIYGANGWNRDVVTSSSQSGRDFYYEVTLGYSIRCVRD